MRGYDWSPKGACKNMATTTDLITFQDPQTWIWVQEVGVCPPSSCFSLRSEQLFGYLVSMLALLGSLGFTSEILTSAATLTNC